MKCFLVYRDKALGDAWRSDFQDVADVELVRGDITQLTVDAVVSPANSFGFMDGGLDNALSERFGWDLQEHVQEQIFALDEGELLVGQSLVIPTGDKDMPWLIVAPTMRVPMSFNIATSVNAYLAMKAILIAAKKHPEISTVAIPGLCTGVGRMPTTTSALQMRTAYAEIVESKQKRFADFGEAQKHQIEINPDGMIWDF